MKVLKITTLKDGTEIQLEDWSDRNTKEFPDLYGYTIVAYPIAKNSSYWIKSGETFRLDIPFNSYAGYTNENIKKDYESLKNGAKKLEDLSEHFYNGEKDKFYLGMENNYRN